MDTAFFSGSKPSLISSKILKDINKELEFSVPDGPTWGQSVGGFYSDYIKPNIFPIIMFSLIALFLLIRYLIKKDKDKKNHHRKKLHSKDYYDSDDYDRDDYDEIPVNGRFIRNDNEYAVVDGKKYEYNELTGKYQPVQETSTEDDYSIEDKLRELS